MKVGAGSVVLRLGYGEARSWGHLGVGAILWGRGCIDALEVLVAVLWAPSNGILNFRRARSI